MRSVASACLCVCPVWALIFESLVVETSCSVCRCIFRISRLRSYVKVIGQGQGHKNKRIQASVTRLTHSLVVCFRLKGNYVERQRYGYCADDVATISDLFAM